MSKQNNLPQESSDITHGVYLIGAGPGAYDLITVRGATILGQADIVFFDALVDEKMLSWCPQAKLVPVGKRCGQFSNSQLFINRQLVVAANKYPVVVRLKGGDPLIFGRASEEIEALQNAQIHFEVIPGITTALAASAQLKQAPTARNISRTLRITTLPTKLNYVDQETLIYYMGRDELIQIANDLILKGYKPDTPVCLMESVSLPEERSFGCTLQDLMSFKDESLFANQKPVIVLVGDVYQETIKHLTPLCPVYKDQYQYQPIAC